MTGRDADTSRSGGVQTRRKKDPNAPKKALTGYLVFLDKHREEIAKANPDANLKDQVTHLYLQQRSIPCILLCAYCSQPWSMSLQCKLALLLVYSPVLACKALAIVATVTIFVHGSSQSLADVHAARVLPQVQKGQLMCMKSLSTWGFLLSFFVADSCSRASTCSARFFFPSTCVKLALRACFLLLFDTERLAGDTEHLAGGHLHCIAALFM